MKKVLVIITVVVAFATSVFAGESSKYTLFSKMNNSKAINGIVQYLEADMDQKSQLQLVLSMTDEKMKLALSEGNEEKAEKALNFNLGNMKILLSEDQYKKYLNLVNVSVNNEEVTFVAER